MSVDPLWRAGDRAASDESFVAACAVHVVEHIFSVSHDRLRPRLALDLDSRAYMPSALAASLRPAHLSRRPSALRPHAERASTAKPLVRQPDSRRRSGGAAHHRHAPAHTRKCRHSHHSHHSRRRSRCSRRSCQRRSQRHCTRLCAGQKRFDVLLLLALPRAQRWSVAVLRSAVDTGCKHSVCSPGPTSSASLQELHGQSNRLSVHGMHCPGVRHAPQVSSVRWANLSGVRVSRFDKMALRQRVRALSDPSIKRTSSSLAHPLTLL
jgi:hypothetical protein